MVSKQFEAAEDRFLKCLQGGRAHPLTACGVVTLCCSPPALLPTEPYLDLPLPLFLILCSRRPVASVRFRRCSDGPHATPRWSQCGVRRQQTTGGTATRTQRRQLLGLGGSAVACTVSGFYATRTYWNCSARCTGAILRATRHPVALFCAGTLLRSAYGPPCRSSETPRPAAHTLSVVGATSSQSALMDAVAGVVKLMLHQLLLMSGNGCCWDGHAAG